MSAFCADFIYPPKLREDDAIAFFVERHGISNKDYRHYERTPDEFVKCISAKKKSVVLFFQPCEPTSPYLMFSAAIDLPIYFML